MSDDKKNENVANDIEINEINDIIKPMQVKKGNLLIFIFA